MSGRSQKKYRLVAFVFFAYEVIDSRAYIALTPSSAKALPYFFRKVKIDYRNPQRYSSTFPFPYEEAKKNGFAFATHHRIICELVEKGFIDPVDKGGLRGCGRSYNLFKLSERWKKYGTQEFEEKSWKSFQPRVK